MRIEVFDVEHGACALVTADNGKYAMIDCGHNATTGWRPGDQLAARRVDRIEALAVTNYDEDHVSGLPNLLDRVHVQSLYRNKSVPPAAIRALKSEDGMGPGINRLVRDIEQVFTLPGSTPDLSGVQIATFRNQYPDEFDDENNLSLAIFIKYGTQSILFPGDLERAGWLQLLRNMQFRAELAAVSVLFASHHGREDGICDELFADGLCHPWYVVISDKQKGHQTQETTDFYRSIARGAAFRGEPRHVLTTRRDGAITFDFASEAWKAY